MAVGTNQVAFVQLGLNKFSAVMMRKHASDVVCLLVALVVIEVHAAYREASSAIRAGL